MQAKHPLKPSSAELDSEESYSSYRRRFIPSSASLTETEKTVEDKSKFKRQESEFYSKVCSISEFSLVYNLLRNNRKKGIKSKIKLKASPKS